MLDDSETSWWDDILAHFEEKYCDTDLEWPLEKFLTLLPFTSVQLPNTESPSMSLDSVPARVKEIHESEKAPTEKVRITTIHSSSDDTVDCFKLAVHMTIT